MIPVADRRIGELAFSHCQIDLRMLPYRRGPNGEVEVATQSRQRGLGRDARYCRPTVIRRRPEMTLMAWEDQACRWSTHSPVDEPRRRRWLYIPDGLRPTSRNLGRRGVWFDLREIDVAEAGFHSTNDAPKGSAIDRLTFEKILF